LLPFDELEPLSPFDELDPLLPLDDPEPESLVEDEEGSEEGSEALVEPEPSRPQTTRPPIMRRTTTPATTPTMRGVFDFFWGAPIGVPGCP
jgi:hypothetical protein